MNHKMWTKLVSRNLEGQETDYVFSSEAILHGGHRLMNFAKLSFYDYKLAVICVNPVRDHMSSTEKWL